MVVVRLVSERHIAGKRYQNALAEKLKRKAKREERLKAQELKAAVAADRKAAFWTPGDDSDEDVLDSDELDDDVSDDDDDDGSGDDGIETKSGRRKRAHSGDDFEVVGADEDEDEEDDDDGDEENDDVEPDDDEEVEVVPVATSKRRLAKSKPAAKNVAADDDDDDDYEGLIHIFRHYLVPLYIIHNFN